VAHGVPTITSALVPSSTPEAAKGTQGCVVWPRRPGCLPDLITPLPSKDKWSNSSQAWLLRGEQTPCSPPPSGLPLTDSAQNGQRVDLGMEVEQSLRHHSVRGDSDTRWCSAISQSTSSASPCHCSGLKGTADGGWGQQKGTNSPCTFPSLKRVFFVWRQGLTM
jgi:hypothetical protein